MKRWLSLLLALFPLLPAAAQSPRDSVALAAVGWDTCSVRPGMVAVRAQLELFGAPQTLSVVRYETRRFRTRIVQPDSLSLTSAVAEREGASAAINAGYFNVRKLVPSTFVRVAGRTIAVTEERESYRVNGVVTLRGRKVRIRPYASSDDARLARRYRDALACGPLLLVGGREVPYVGRKGDFWGRHPRSLIGVTKRGDVVMVVVDGRFPKEAAGMTVGELAFVARQLGLHAALNLDGGGSSTLWCDDCGIINHPSDNKRFDSEGERRVTNCIVAEPYNRTK